MNYGAGNWRRIRKQQLSASLITENPKYKRDEKHKLNITIPLSYLSLRGRGKICLEKVGAHVLLLLSRKVRNDLIMFVNQLANSGMNCPKRIRNRTLRLAKMCRIRIWKQPLALIKNFHLTSLRHKEARARNENLKTLTPRELEVAKLLATGAPNKVVADQLGMTTRTAQVHRAAIYLKLGVHSAVEIAELVRTTD